VQKGISVNAIYGDPALLMPKLFPNLELKTQRNKIIVIPNLNEEKVCIENTPENFTYISPMNHWTFVLNEILTSELVLSSSLHGIILAEAFGVPVRFVKPVGGETMFKYEDYYLGTNRELTQEPSTFKDPITSKSGIEMPDLKFDISMLLDAFPVDLFKPKYKTIS
jgi:pyruvyltransferase